MNTNIKIAVIVLLIILIIYFNLSNNDTFISGSGEEWANRNNINNNQTNKPSFTTYNNGSPMPTELHLGEYYNNEAIPTISSSDFKVSPHCCPSAHSTSSGCVCYNK